MRQPPSGVRLGCARRAGLVLALVLAPSVPIGAQTSAPESAPLARYVPRDDLTAYAEFDGLDAHADAWKNTAAYQMLNETPLGAMLEELGKQLVDQALAKAPSKKLNSTEIVTLAKHAFHSGFAFAMNAKKDAETPSSVILVIRGAARKDVRAPVSRTLLSFAGKSGKPKLASKGGGRNVVVMPSDTRAEAWAWWAEQDDLVIALDQPQTAEIIIEVIDGKRPSAVDHPVRTELAAAENGFLPVCLAFLDTATVSLPKGVGESARAQLGGVTRVDYRWGFQDKALMNVWRLVAPSPRQGAFALVDGPKFDLKSLPPMPDAVEGFTAVSLDLPQTYDALLALAKSASPDSATQASEAVATLKTKYKIDLRKDILAQLGPKMVFFVAPGKLAPTPPAGADRPAAPSAGGIPNPLTMMLAAVPLPKFAFVLEVKNATAFTKKLDELMIAANKMLRESAKASAAPAAKAGDDDGEDAPADRKRAAAAVPAPKFEMMAGKAKGYSLVLPSELGKLPAGVKPAIRVGEKYVVIGVNPAVAAQALEAKEAWKPAGDFTTALASAPEGLVLLNVSDPRGTMPQELASLPRTIQTAINTAIQNALAGAMAGMPGAPGPAGAMRPGGSPSAVPQPGQNSPPLTSPGQNSPPLTSPGQNSPPLTSPGQSTSSSAPGFSGPTGTPNFAGAMGTNAAAPAGAIVLRIDPSKMPAADALKAFLFPAYAALSANDHEIRFVTREAFPNIASGGAASSPGASMILGPAMQKAREAAMKQLAAQAQQGRAGATAPAEKPK